MTEFVLPQTDHWNHSERFYDMQLLAYIGVVFDPQRPIIDVGANVGYVTRFLALRSQSYVTAYEPSLQNYACLEENTKDLENVTRMRLAVGASRSAATFLDNATVTSHIVRDDSRSKNLSRVEVVTIDESLITDVGLLKIDVEGYEMRVLEGAVNMISKHRPIVVIETKDEWLKRQGDNVESIVNFFRLLEYQHPVDKFGRRTTDASDLIFAPPGIYLPKPYLAFEHVSKSRLRKTKKAV